MIEATMYSVPGSLGGFLSSPWKTFPTFLFYGSVIQSRTEYMPSIIESLHQSMKFATKNEGHDDMTPLVGCTNNVVNRLGNIFNVAFVYYENGQSYSFG